MLVTVVRELTEYENIVITLFENNHFGKELVCDKYYSLNLKMTDFLILPLIVLRLKKLLKSIDPDLIHTHLYWPTVLTRIAASRKVPVITTVHAFVSQLVDYRKWYFRWFYRFTYKLRRTTIIAVAKGALDEYFTFLKLKRNKAFHLYTFVDTSVYNFSEQSFKPSGISQVVSVGALRFQKNQIYLLKAFSQLKDNSFKLDIYGTGPLKNELESYIKLNSVQNVALKGQVSDIKERLPEYHLFTMSSLYEGFSLGVLEAMAMKLPLLLSDIPSFREQCGETAVFFDLKNENDFVTKLNWMKDHPLEVDAMVSSAELRVKENFTLTHHMSNLRKIYHEVLTENR
jgi:glycosyltransferase involved in cell wall biosynthesis